MTKILPCTCSNPYQDKQYGTQRRVHNALIKGTKQPQQYRCTVCNKIGR